ncbi:MAG: hypothetical protein ACF8LK_06940 [Phycisphaerales bacterium JB041]
MVRGSLWAVIARRSSASAYGRWRAGRAAPGSRSMRALMDADGPLAQPTLVEQLAVSLADRLPGLLVRALGVRGLLALAWVLAAPFRLAGVVVGVAPGVRASPAEGGR